ncbi:MAG: energy transducer TonB [Flavobacteriales bacterium]|nr:energy transducer TonB [Flavobacteriales bacterium]
METKKSKKSDMRKLRSTLFFLGMCVSIGSVYAMMSFTKYKYVQKTLSSEPINDAIYESPMITYQTPQVTWKKPDTKINSTNPSILTSVSNGVSISKPTVEQGAVTEMPDGWRQNSVPDDNLEDVDKIYSLWGLDVSDRAKFPGGEEARVNYIQQNLIFPNDLSDAPNGTILVTFIIEKDGSISDVKVSPESRRLGFGLEEAAMNVVKQMPKWIPAKQMDKPVRMRLTMPIRINIGN